MRKRRRLTVACGLLLLYVTAYLALSRHGYAVSREEYHIDGFYYFTPNDSVAWRLSNYGCEFLFWPLNVVDRWFGTGMAPAYEPFWELSG